jgi:large subunit ribosomal protein L6
MSRVASNPVSLPKGVELNQAAAQLTVKGPKGQLSMPVHGEVEVSVDDGAASVAARSGSRLAKAMAGTTRALISNMVRGVSDGFERKLILNGVGYRAAVQGKKLSLTLGFSHPVEYELPDGISAETPTQTEIVLKGIDKQALGQAAAEIRAFRPPEPYKGKGVRYADEYVRRKEAKKK